MKINNNGNTFRTLLKTAVVGSLATGVGSQYFSTAPANQCQTCVTPEGVNKYGFATAPINAMNVTSVCLEEINNALNSYFESISGPTKVLLESRTFNATDITSFSGTIQGVESFCAVLEKKCGPLKKKLGDLARG